MIKKISKYIIFTMLAIICGYILAISFKNLNKVYTKVQENNKKINFLENTNNPKKPLLCFQTAYELAKNTNIKLPEITPLGTIPLKNTTNLVNFDRYGFRNNDNVWKKKQHDFLILGDSVVVDNSISDKSIFSNNFKNKSAINLGCGGNGLLTSLYLIEQIAQTGYNFRNILFFLNFNNDFSKDTLREYNTLLFSQTSKSKSKNIFLNKEQYKLDYLNFVKEAFSKEVFNFSIKKELFNNFKLDKYFEYNVKFNINKKATKALLEDGTYVDSTFIVEGAYNIKMYNVFLKILERITFLKQNYNSDITFVFVPTNAELNIYKSESRNDIEWGRYLNYKFFKNTILSTVANYNINILDLYYFIKEKNYEGFQNGHFMENHHKHLSVYLDNSISNEINKMLGKLYYYNSFFPSKKYFNYQVNFGNKLDDTQVIDWINVINFLIERKLIDNYLLTPSLGYFFINQDCENILKLHKLSNAQLSNFSVGSFFYKTCNLKNSHNIIESIKEINFLIDKDVKYYIPNISNEIKKSLELINEN